MTDYRRPDLDLWEEEEDAEDARPTIVAERPTAGVPIAKLAMRRLDQAERRTPVAARAPEAAADRVTPEGAAERVTPEVGRSALLERLIQQGALDDALVPRDSVEALRDSDVAALRVSDVAPQPPALPAESEEPDDLLADDETEILAMLEPPPLVPALPPLARVNPPALRAAATRDRDVTERISMTRISTAGSPASSLAPTAHTLRPGERKEQGFPWWQAAAAALLFAGGGLYFAQQSARVADTRTSAAVSESSRTVEAPPAPVAEPVAITPPAPARADDQTPVAASDDLSSGAVAPGGTETAVPAVARPKPNKPRERPLVRDADDAQGQDAEEGERAGVSVTAQTADAPAARDLDRAKDLADLPAQPTREQVTAALNAVVPELSRCVEGFHGTAHVAVTVRPHGVVSHAIVTGTYAGTPEGSCIARAVKTAKFPPFSADILRVEYPFQL